MPPASDAASLTMMLTGVPVRASSDPARAAKARGMSICEGGIAGACRDDDDERHERGNRAVDADQSGEHGNEEAHDDEERAASLAASGDELSDRPRPSRLSQSSDSPTTKSVAMKMTVGSPNRARGVGEGEDRPSATTPPRRR